MGKIRHSNFASKKVLITGSNARLMSRELATYLTGRHIDFTLFPFSFREFLKYPGHRNPKRGFVLY